MAMTKTRQLHDNISRLEQQIAERVEQVRQFREKLAQAHENGKPSDELAKQYTGAQALLEAEMKTLVDLDARLVIVSKEENTTCRDALRKEAEDGHRKAMRKIDKKTGELCDALREYLPEPAHESLAAMIGQAVARAVWDSLNQSFSDRYTIEVPAVVHHAPRRDEYGKRI